MFDLNFRDSRPIYEQIKDAIRRLIVTGVLAQNEKLPSVRELASSKSLNPNTIQRAYRELEAEGYIYSVPGKGSFVAVEQGVLDKRAQELMPRLTEIVKELQEVGVSADEVKKQIDAVYERERQND